MLTSLRLTRSCSRNAPVGISRPCARLSYVAYQQLRKCQTHRLPFTYQGCRFRTSLGYGLCSVPSSSLATFALHTPKPSLSLAKLTLSSLGSRNAPVGISRPCARLSYVAYQQLRKCQTHRLPFTYQGSRNKKASRPNILNPSKNLLSQPRI